MEVSGQARQLELSLIPVRTGCDRFIRSLHRWLEFRLPLYARKNIDVSLKNFSKKTSRCDRLLRCVCLDERLTNSIERCALNCVQLTRRVRYAKPMDYDFDANASCRIFQKVLNFLICLLIYFYKLY
jgi:hypothetical protein